MIARRLVFVLSCLTCEGLGRRVREGSEPANISPLSSLVELSSALGSAAAFSPPVSGTSFRVSGPTNAQASVVTHVLQSSRAAPLTLRRRSTKPVASLIAASTLPTDFSIAILPHLRPSLMPVLGVIVFCLVGMVPSGLLAWRSKYSKLFRRVFTGCVLGIVVSLWVFSGTYCFLFVFSLMAIIAQNEYFAMARENGCIPTWKLGTLGSIGMYLAACSRNPVLRDALFPLTGTVTIVYLMLRRSVVGIEKTLPPLTMNDVATTFMGIYYFGYMPSFWVRLQSLGPLAPSIVLGQLLPPTSSIGDWPIVSNLAAFLSPSCGTIIQWWTMFAIVSADVFAFFVGRQFGKTPLVDLSPKKTLEGLIGGCAASMLAMSAGAVCMGWPRPLLSGSFYGFMCAIMALIGDLTVSLLKRSAGIKDTGSLLPGHGGLLDRIDSYLLVPAPAYFFVRWLLPMGP